jgi:hypothetical protein
MTGLMLTEGLGLTETGIKTDSNEQQTAKLDKEL